jgi:hypothetical protein
MAKLVLIFLLLFAHLSRGQTFGLQLRDATSIDIPFEFHNNLIIVDVVLGNTLPLKFIFDTGAEHSIICKKEIASILNLNFEREFVLLGADLKKTLKAYLVKGVRIDLINHVAFATQDMLVLEDDYYRLDECTGQPIHGIMGADFFNRYVVTIDYIRKKIKLTEPTQFRPAKGTMAIPIEISRGKPYFSPQLMLRPNESFAIKLLIDTGAGLSLLLFNNTHPSLQPPENSLRGILGMGLGGNVEGYLGRINQLNITDKLGFNNLVCDFQDIVGIIDSSVFIQRNGIFGEKLLSRFDITLDYLRNVAYLKPNRWYKKPIMEDKSGLMVMAHGLQLNEFYVNDVIPGSPASWADIRQGDYIRRINRIPVSFYTIDKINQLLAGKEGKIVKLKIERNGKKYDKQFHLRNLFSKQHYMQLDPLQPSFCF